MMAVRQLGEADIGSAATLVAELPLYRDYGYAAPSVARDLIGALRDGSSDLRGAWLDGELAAVAWVLPQGGFGRSPYLRLLAVAQGKQALGLGRALMKDLEARWATRHHLLLLVSEPNAPARRFYERLGYREVGRIPGYVRAEVDECLYLKDLRAPEEAT